MVYVSTVGIWATRSVTVAIISMLRCRVSSRGGSAPSTAFTPTPRRVLQAQQNSMNRFSMSGRAQGSTIGAKAFEDSRPLEDKGWQKKAKKDLIDFLNDETVFPKKLSETDFPPSVALFKTIFEFLVGYLIPDYDVRAKKDPRPFEAKTPELLAEIGYPVKVLSSSLKTTSSPHSWKTILGVLNYLHDRVKVLDQLQEGIKSLGFPKVDEHGFPLEGRADDELVYDHFVHCYQAFNNNQDRYDDELDELEEELEAGNNFNQDVIRQLQQDTAKYTDELQELEAFPLMSDKLQADRATKQQDLDKMNSFKTQMVAHVQSKEKDLAEAHKRVKVVKQKVQVQKGVVSELDEKCRHNNINVTQTDMIVRTLRHQLDNTKDNVQEAERQVAKKEISFNKQLEELDNYIRHFNTELNGLELETSHLSQLRMDLTRHPRDLDLPLQTLLIRQKESEREIFQRHDKAKSHLVQQQKDVQKTSQECDKLEKEQRRLKETTAVEQEQQESNEKVLDAEINKYKQYLLDMRNKETVNLERLKTDAEEVEDKVERTRQECEEALMEEVLKVQEAMDRGEAFIAKRNEDCWAKRREYEEAVALETAAYETFIKEMDDLHDKIMEL